jgi:hypothetical protein
MKSYGRAPTFLMLTGYEQVRSVVCALTGDQEGARNVSSSSRRREVQPAPGPWRRAAAPPACC